MRMFIHRDCLKIKNEAGVTLSIGGDDNCRRDGVKDRMTVLFHDDTDADVEAPIYTREQKENGAIDVWTNPKKLLECVAEHLGYSVAKKVEEN